ncbi:MAG: hypothetical protein AVDCRST_MAG17-2287 [uncultured Solirubrobacterales bacterium]|uniref:Uncharacterized protein n=1 Tax=uncultured Solirubrobacterales bacterium TaxID=768556 RepID=A0A6J4T7T7_9ACTN|nr:MAG: hypothetical protein AVDCRST_MAG17-2287 [uncultured Solirubrobacterales bacterium]
MATLVLLRYDARREAWERARHPVVFGDSRDWSEAEATALGEAWRGEGANERRAYSVLTSERPFDLDL